MLAEPPHNLDDASPTSCSWEWENHSPTTNALGEQQNVSTTTSESGPAIYGASGQIVGKSLEGSNTDIADEFTKLIVTQQAYAANTRIVTTADQMLQETINMIR